MTITLAEYRRLDAAGNTPTMWQPQHQHASHFTTHHYVGSGRVRPKTAKA